MPASKPATVSGGTTRLAKPANADRLKSVDERSGATIGAVSTPSPKPTEQITVTATPAMNAALASGAPAAPDCRTFVHDISVAPGHVVPGTYRAVISLTYEVAPGTPGPMAGHANLGYIQIYA